ncbi:MAG: type II methionyl aminopeptidase [Candidatus Heimdallarchaeaceae archaeon]
MDAMERYYCISGQIHYQAMEFALSLIEPGVLLLEIAEKVENFIREKGAYPAFPVNISINEIAAHYSPIIFDDLVIPEESVVKIDLGVVVNGFITDAARTKIFNEKYVKLKLSAEKALENALKKIKEGVHVYEVGEVIEKTIKKEGFKPVINLSGHSLAQYSLHDGLSIPNYSKPKRSWDKNEIFRKNQAYAVEPFATTGKGVVINCEGDTIFRQISNLENVEIDQRIREVYNFIKRKFKNLPFTPRWLYNNGFSLRLLEDAMNELIEKDVLHGYTVLREITNKPVVQAEDTLFISSKNKKVILTRIKKEKKIR